MSVRAGSIITVAGRNVVDRLQSAGLTNAQVPVETIREIGNDLVVDKVPGDPDFTFAMTSWDVSTDMIAFLQGKVGNQVVGQPPGYNDPDFTEYRWENCQFVNITSPWKSDTGSQGGHIKAGLIIPGYYVTRMHYTLGAVANASVDVELAGGAYYYAETPPVEEIAAGDGIVVAFVSTEPARAFREGGAGGTTFRRIFGVLVNGVLQVGGGVDYTESVPGGTLAGAPAVTTITFVVPPPAAAQVRFCYFTETAKVLPQAVNADATVKPGAVRGRNIVVMLGPDGSQVRMPGIQTVDLDATVTGTAEREMGNSEITGRSIDGTDVTGSFTVRPKDIDAFFNAMSQVTGVAKTEVFGYLNQRTVQVEVQIRDPKNPAQTLKSLLVRQGQFQPPGTPARVNTPTDFQFSFNALDGTYSEFKKGRS